MAISRTVNSSVDGIKNAPSWLVPSISSVSFAAIAYYDSSWLTRTFSACLSLATATIAFASANPEQTKKLVHNAVALGQSQFGLFSDKKAQVAPVQPVATAQAVEATESDVKKNRREAGSSLRL